MTKILINRRVLTSLAILSVTLLVISTPAAHAVEHPEVTIGERNVVFTNGALTASFEGMGPKVKFYDHNALTRSEQQVNFRALIEFNDADHNGVFESSEAVARAVLDEGRWTHTGFYSLPGASGIGINFTLADPIVLSGSHATLLAGSVILVVKAYNATQTITVDGKPVTITNAEIKVDFVVKNFPFTNNTNMLALQVNMHSSTEHYDLEETTGAHTADGTHPEGTATTEHEFHQTTDVSQETKMSSGSITASSTVGLFRFVNKATITPPTGASYTVPVTASYKTETETDAGETATFMKLYLAYPNYQGTLVHDPSIGLSNTLPTLYLIAGAAGAAALIAVSVIRRRHVRVQKESVPKIQQ
jgi:hypothetical protein